MGAKVSCFRGFSTLPKEVHCGDHQRLMSSTEISVVDFLKPKCLWADKKKNMGMQQKVEQEYDQHLTTVKEAVTLEEWFLASPVTGDYYFCTNNGGEFYALKHSSNKIYPSLAADFTSKPKDTTSILSLERLLKMEEIDSDQEMGVISTTSILSLERLLKMEEIDGDQEMGVISTTSILSLERPLKMKEIDSDQEMGVISPVSTSQSGKQKKRVSFKLPQESDIIIFHSLVVDCEDC